MLFCVYLLAFSNVTPYINANQSAESVLETIADSKGCISDATNNRVGVSTKNSFSHYWVAKNWGNELSRELKISYVSPETAATSNVCHYLTKTKSLASLPKSLTNAFDLMGKFGEWTVFLKKSTNQKLPTAISLNTK
jgi:hypothetical protein